MPRYKIISSPTTLLCVIKYISFRLWWWWQHAFYQRLIILNLTSSVLFNTHFAFRPHFEYKSVILKHIYITYIYAHIEHIFFSWFLTHYHLPTRSALFIITVYIRTLRITRVNIIQETGKKINEQKEKERTSVRSSTLNLSVTLKREARFD